MSPLDPALPPPPPPVLPPRPDLAPTPPPARRKRRWPVIVAMVLAALVLAAQLSVIWDAVDAGRGQGDAQGEHAFLGRSADGPYRWNPCQPIHYEVNLEHAPPGALDDVREAVARVSEATGIEFVDDGTTIRTVDMQMGRAFQSRVPGEDRFLPLLVEWVPHEHFDFVADTHRAAAFGIPYRGFGADLVRTYVSGVIAMDAGERLSGGFGERYSRGVILMHELGHVMGLAHVASPNEIMWSPDVSEKRFPDLLQTEWGPGDLEGLELLGREAGCLPER